MEALGSLAMGPRDNMLLREVYINNYGLATQDFEIIYEAIANNTNINILNLSRTRLDDHCSMMVGK